MTTREEKMATAKQKYDEFMVGNQELSEIERLRFFCSCAMSGQDWLDVEPFFEDLAPAIETAAYMRAAAAVACPGRTIFDTEKAIIALIPKDGRTQLEEFGMKVATETRAAVLINTREDLFTEDSSLRAIVTNLIGVPPLSSESVSGEGK